MDDNKKTDIITVPSLNQYFYDSLERINKNSLSPLPQETIYYSSEVLCLYSSSENLYEMKEGRVREKVLGKKLLKAVAAKEQEKSKLLKEVGDTSLLLCGYFSESVNSKILDSNYYRGLGVTAYKRLNTLRPKELDVPSFYITMAESFSILCKLLATFAAMDKSDPYDHMVFDFTTDTTKAS